jgi:FAD/FMN-containing dehydrogenase
MNKIAQYLQGHITGEIITGNDARRQFSTDASIFLMTPNVVVYPRNENDVRKTTKFTWQLAERGRIFPITARGSGTDQGGAAIGNGILLVFPAHLNRILELDSKSGTIVVEPGLNFGKLQQTLYTHDRFLPSAPSSLEYSTIGGALANNASGAKSFKYGSTLDFVKSLRVVLSNGDVIETHRISKRELSKKLGLSSFEGEIYRTIDALIEDNQDIVKKFNLSTTKNSAGYNINLVKQKDGSFDLTPLFIGSQGTLGLITEAELQTMQRRTHSTLVMARVKDLDKLQKIVLELRKLPEVPCAIEVVDKSLLELAHKYDSGLISASIDEPFPEYVLLIEFDNLSEHIQKKLLKRTQKILSDNESEFIYETDPVKKEEIWKVRQSTTAILMHGEGNAKPIPIIEDGIVPPENLEKLITGIHEIFDKNNIPISIYGHAGDGHLHLQPLLDIKQVGDRQKIFKVMDEYYKLVLSLDGSVSGSHGEGRLRASYLPLQYGIDAYAMIVKIKQTFDPHGILNPGVKIGGDIEGLKPLLREEYSLGHLYSYLPYL